MTTLLAAGAVTLAVVVVQKWPVPFLQSPRIATIALLVIGIAMCTASGYTPDQSLYTIFMGILGGAVVLVSIVALASGIAGWAAAVAGIVVLMWVISTVRHLLG